MSINLPVCVELQVLEQLSLGKSAVGTPPGWLVQQGSKQILFCVNKIMHNFKIKFIILLKQNVKSTQYCGGF